ncbi:MAG: hypothetical protein HY903_10105 [Deltaproteobacteria bacterium]|nr:hypothetical protein [Deltaproteobacteria bacterium]
MHTARFARALVVAAALAAVPQVAHAEMTIKDDSTHSRAMHADAFVVGGFFGYFHFGLGAWFAYPIMPDGFLPTLNDAFFIEAGGAVERYSWDWGFFGVNCSYKWYRATPLGGVRWSFYLTPDWTVYGTAKLGYGVGFASSYSCGGYSGTDVGAPSYSNIAIDGAVGAHWNFSPDWAARLELGYFGVQAGAGMDIAPGT